MRRGAAGVARLTSPTPNPSSPVAVWTGAEGRPEPGAEPGSDPGPEQRYSARMRKAVFGLIGLILLVLAAPGGAQEGHPLTGTWSGDWGPGATQRTHITMVMTWDGKTIGGTINPGPDAIPVAAIALDVTTWTVRFDADAKAASGPVRISVEGRLDDIASAHRTITGTWRQGTSTGDFKLTRD